MTVDIGLHRAAEIRRMNHLPHELKSRKVDRGRTRNSLIVMAATSLPHRRQTADNTRATDTEPTDRSSNHEEHRVGFGLLATRYLWGSIDRRHGKQTTWARECHERCYEGPRIRHVLDHFQCSHQIEPLSCDDSSRQQAAKPSTKQNESPNTE